MSTQFVVADKIRLVIEPNASDWLVVTFAHMGFDKGNNSFWGQAPLRKLGYSSVGVVCRGNHWFPYNDMVQLSGKIREVAACHKKTILYGFSMGGYAAVKYSSLLKADVSIALSPQYSISPKDVLHHDRRLVNHFDADLNANMAITPTDISGKLYLFYDPYVIPDRWNCEQIIRQDPTHSHIQALMTPRIGHETIDIFASTEALDELIKRCSEEDISALHMVTARFRKRVPRRIFNALSKLNERSPARAARLFDEYSGAISPYWREQWRKLSS